MNFQKELELVRQQKNLAFLKEAKIKQKQNAEMRADAVLMQGHEVTEKLAVKIPWLTFGKAQKLALTAGPRIARFLRKYHPATLRTILNRNQTPGASFDMLHAAQSDLLNPKIPDFHPKIPDFHQSMVVETTCSTFQIATLEDARKQQLCLRDQLRLKNRLMKSNTSRNIFYTSHSIELLARSSLGVYAENQPQPSEQERLETMSLHQYTQNECEKLTAYGVPIVWFEQELYLDLLADCQQDFMVVEVERKGSKSYALVGNPEQPEAFVIPIFEDHVVLSSELYNSYNFNRSLNTRNNVKTDRLVTIRLCTLPLVADSDKVGVTLQCLTDNIFEGQDYKETLQNQLEKHKLLQVHQVIAFYVLGHQLLYRVKRLLAVDGEPHNAVIIMNRDVGVEFTV